jgi:hypothetical protein
MLSPYVAGWSKSAHDRGADVSPSEAKGSTVKVQLFNDETSLAALQLGTARSTFRTNAKTEQKRVSIYGLRAETCRSRLARRMQLHRHERGRPPMAPISVARNSLGHDTAPDDRVSNRRIYLGGDRASCFADIRDDGGAKHAGAQCYLGLGHGRHRCLR